MSQPQSWALSQEANKRKGICSVCFETRQLKNSDGTVHRHGPRKNPCSGSDKPPLKILATNQPAAPAFADNRSQPDIGQAVCLNAAPTPDKSGTLTAPDIESTTGFSDETISTCFKPYNGQLIKHIPKSARPACSSQLATLLSAAVAKPQDTVTWMSLMLWPRHILQPSWR